MFQGVAAGFLAGFFPFFHHIFLAVEPPGSPRKKTSKNDTFYKLFFRIGAKNQSGAKHTFSESSIANRKYQKTTGFISFLAHRKIIANQKCQKTPGFISFFENRKSKMSKNDRFYKLFGTLQIKSVKTRQVL